MLSLAGNGTCGAALPLPESLPDWVPALTPSRSGGRAQAARTPETPLRRGVRTGPKALACLGHATPPRPERLDHSPYKPRPAPPSPARPLPECVDLSPYKPRPSRPAPPSPELLDHSPYKPRPPHAPIPLSGRAGAEGGRRSGGRSMVARRRGGPGGRMPTLSSPR